MAQKKKNAAWADCCEDWGGYMAAKKAKLEEQFQEAVKNEFSERSTLFNGVAIFVNGYTDPTADQLKRIMMAHGGIYHHYLRSQSTTHMIASNLPYSKIVAYRKAQNPLPLCKPEWITNSLKAGKLLDYRNYLLYSQCTKNQPAIFVQLSKQSKPQQSQAMVGSLNSTMVSSAENSKGADKTQVEVETTSNSEIPSVIANCTKNPEFLTEFYNNSRLHHIATMGAMFKDYINDLRDKSDGKFSGLDALKKQSYTRRCKAGPSSRIDYPDSDDDLFNNDQYASVTNLRSSASVKKGQIIMHIDMDCFFVSVGLRNHPELRGFPVAVAHAKGNKQSTSNDPNEYGSMSEIASCSYEARKAGVKNGMLLGQALKLCPNLKTIRYDFDGYKEVSYTLYNTVASYTLDIEAVSCDEMYADCTKILETTGLTQLEFASVIRNEIKEKTGCPVSTGFGENKLQARLATKRAKPDGQYYLKGNDVKSFIRTLNVRDLPGVGYSTSHKLNQINVQTCADLEAISLYELQKEFGKKNGQQLHDMCRGIDDTKLNLEHVRKSISAEVNYGIRFENTEAAHEFLRKLSLEISDRLKKINSKGKCITLKVMFRAKEAPNEPKKFMGHGLCDAFNKSKNLIAPTDDPVIITREVLSLWNQLNQNPEDARGLGIQITKLESSKNKSSGATLLKFIDKMKVSEKNIKESKSSIDSTDTEQKNKLELQETNAHHSNQHKENVDNKNSRDANEITLSLENELLTDEIQFNCESVDIYQEKDELSDEMKAETSNKSTNIKVKKPEEQPPKNSSQLKQTKQSEYFKHVKSSLSNNRSSKFKMPDINEIDMKVLIELPEDIRNEILNEYKENKDNEIVEKSNSERPSMTANCSEKTSNSNHRLERDLSFSQIDPDFLAALPEDMKNEVKSYCDAQKKGKNLQAEEKQSNNFANKGWNMFKTEKKTQKNAKLKSGKIKNTKCGGKKETKSTASSSNKITKRVETKKPAILESEKATQAQAINNILTANKSFHFDHSDGNTEHSEILSSLVNCLIDLPISQVKLQIREWIYNNSDVNDVDFLSFTTYLGTLPRKRRIVDLHILLKCLHRCILNSGSCIWHETYQKMLEHIQTRMRSEYGYNLMIPQQIDCDKCNTIKM